MPPSATPTELDSDAEQAEDHEQAEHADRERSRIADWHTFNEHVNDRVTDDMRIDRYMASSWQDQDTLAVHESDSES